MEKTGSQKTTGFYLGILGGVILGGAFAYLVALLVRQRMQAFTQNAVPEEAARHSGNILIEIDHQSGPPTPSSEQDLTTPDNLKKIEGIGTKTETTLYAAGIKTYHALSAATPDAIRTILDQAGMPKMINPSSWSEQAALAAKGDWEGLAVFQSQLKGGRA